MIKTWQQRILEGDSRMPSVIVQAEIDELREAFANLHSDYDIIETDREELQAKLAESEKCLQDSIDCNLNKLLAMTDEQVTALTRLEGSNPEEVAALARKTIEQLRQEVTAWSITAENLEAERDALAQQKPVEHQYQSRDGKWNSFLNEGHYQNTLEDGSWPIRALFLAAGAALASQEPVAEVLLVDGEKVIDASMAFFDSVELGTKLYLAAGAAPVQQEEIDWLPLERWWVSGAEEYLGLKAIVQDMLPAAPKEQP